MSTVMMPESGPRGQPQELLCSHSWVQIPLMTFINILYYIINYTWLAQSVERTPFKRVAASSSLASGIFLINK
jgi:hypothetical protein